SVLFFSPHSLMYFSLNHLSYAGTKCTHWRIFKLFLAIAPQARFGTIQRDTTPVASAPAAVVLIKSRRVMLLPAMDSLLSALNPDSFRKRSNIIFIAQPR